MPKRSNRHSADASEYIYAPSASSEEDWGDDAWEVDGIIGEHVDTRGERRFVIGLIVSLSLLTWTIQVQSK